MKLVKLKNITSILTGFSFAGDDYSDYGIPVIRGENITEGRLRWDKKKCWNMPFEKKAYFSLKKNDIVVGMDGSKVGKNKCRIKEVDLPLLLAQRVACIRSNDDLNQIFLYYCIDNIRFEKYVFKIQTGSSVPHISKNQIQNFTIPFPALSIQKKIANILLSLDSKIEVNNKINSELEKIAKTLYDYWFVQFDFTDKNGKPYKSNGGKMIYNEKLKREIPDGWKVKRMDDLINIDKSGDWGKEEKKGNYIEKVFCIRGADINGLNGKGDLKPPIRYILEKNSYKILKPHDLIIEISGGSPTQSTGRMAFITNSTSERFKNPLICSNFCKPISLKNDKFLYNFAHYWDSLYEDDILFRYEGKTSGIKNLLLESLTTSCYLVVPETKILNKFYDLMENINTKKQLNLAENQKLAELRDWLLPMLMNGQVEMK